MGSKTRPGIPLNAIEKRALSGLGTIFALRMVGLFMVLPILAIYAEDLAGQTPLLVGLAVGIYGLTQAGLQIPMGMASNYWGRKRIIAIGLLVFVAGSVLAALADSIYMLILGRAVQGAGAIAAAMTALTADMTRENQRTKAMAIIGVTIGGAFMVALLVGPLLQAVTGVSGMFWLAAAMAILALLVLFFWVPKPGQLPKPQGDIAGQLRAVFYNGQLMRMNVGIFFLHSVMTALFVVLPLSLLHYAEMPVERHWQAYLPTMIGGVLIMIPMIGLAERKQKMRLMYLAAIVMVLVSQVILGTAYQTLTGLLLGLWIFFVGFNFLEASIPSLISKAVGPGNRGTAMGVFSTFQFFGAFAGGVLAGLFYGQFGISSVFALGAVLMLCWLVLAWKMVVVAPLQMQTVPVANMASDRLADLVKVLTDIPGVSEVVPESGVLHLRVDEKILDKESLDKALAAI